MECLSELVQNDTIFFFQVGGMIAKGEERGPEVKMFFGVVISDHFP